MTSKKTETVINKVSFVRILDATAPWPQTMVIWAYKNKAVLEKTLKDYYGTRAYHMLNHWTTDEEEARKAEYYNQYYNQWRMAEDRPLDLTFHLGRLVKEALDSERGRK